MFFQVIVDRLENGTNIAIGSWDHIPNRDEVEAFVYDQGNFPRVGISKYSIFDGIIQIIESTGLIRSIDYNFDGYKVRLSGEFRNV